MEEIKQQFVYLSAEVEVIDRLAAIKHVMLVMSGKGGVGKSTVAVQLALGVKDAGFKVRSRIAEFVLLKYTVTKDYMNPVI